MITLSAAVIAACLWFAFLLARLTFAKRSRFDAVAAFVPGAPVASIVKATRRRKLRFSTKQAESIDAELPDLVELMAVVLETGESIQAAFELIAQRGRGQFATQMRQVQSRMKLGSTLDAELQALCVELPTSGVREFANKIAIAINRGTPLAQSLASLAQTLRRRAANQLLRKAGANETKMLIPLVTIVLPVTVIFALYPSSVVLQLGF